MQASSLNNNYVAQSGKGMRWHKIIVTTVMICAFLPKLVIGEGTNIYLPEIVVMLGLFAFGTKQMFVFVEQRYLFVIFFSMLLFSLIAQASVSDIGAVLRSIKEILYIPIIYWASKVEDKRKALRSIIKCGCAALAINIMFYMLNYSQDNSIWAGAEFLSSGMSNRGFDISSFKLVQLQGLAHGIWGSYCVLILILGLSQFQKKEIGIKLFIAVCFLFGINMVISVSRESLLILTFVMFCYLLLFKGGAKYKIFMLVILATAIVLVIAYGSTLPIVQKLVYTADSVSSEGTESNVQIRVNTWITYAKFLLNEPQYIFVGLGISSENFLAHINSYSGRLNIVGIPESAFVYMIAYGGIVSLIYMLLLIKVAAVRIHKKSPYNLLKYFFAALILTNLLSGVSMFSDLLYAHLCLVYGLLILNNNDDQSTTHYSTS